MEEKHDAQAIIDFAQANVHPETIELKRGTAFSASAVLLPANRQIFDPKKILDQYRTAPERRKGTATFSKLESFIAHTNRFRGPSSALFAATTGAKQHKTCSLASVLDYHPEGAPEIAEPRFCEHRGVYEFPVSDEWQTWSDPNQDEDGGDGWLGQGSFALFIETHIVDVIDPKTALPGTEKWAADLDVRFASAAKLMELSRGLSMKVDGAFESATMLATGEGKLVWTEEYKDASGNKLVVPGAFLIAIPVFRFGTPYQIPVRLLFRKRGAAVVWRMMPARMDETFDRAFSEACEHASAETTLPLMFGTPER